MMTFKSASLPKNILAVIQQKGTEAPFSGAYNDFEDRGTYLCRKCGLALFRSQHKFHSGCGWPSFDEEIETHVTRKKDADGLREELLCARCQAHLGHEFYGEQFTKKNVRQCINSLSLDFVRDEKVLDSKEAIFAAGCFWGVDYLFQKLQGVLKTEVGYTGGSKKKPSYEDVCSGHTGHYEAVRIVYDPQQIDFKTLVQFFFEIHDPTQTTGQGPDLGSQYLSVIFFYDLEQKQMSQAIMDVLTNKGYQLATILLPVTTFWAAENYHQDYYSKNNKQPYCHFYKKKF